MLAFDFCAEVSRLIRALALILIMHSYCTAIRDMTALAFLVLLLVSHAHAQPLVFPTRKERRKRDRDATEQQEAGPRSKCRRQSEVLVISSKQQRQYLPKLSSR